MAGKSDWWLAIVLYPFTWGAVAINLFMFSLIGRAIGLPSFAPTQAVLTAAIISVPLNYLALRWIRRLLDEAERDS